MDDTHTHPGTQQYYPYVGLLFEYILPPMDKHFTYYYNFQIIILITSCYTMRTLPHSGCAESKFPHSSKLLKSTEVVIGVDQLRLRIDNLGNRSLCVLGGGARTGWTSQVVCGLHAWLLLHFSQKVLYSLLMTLSLVRQCMMNRYFPYYGKLYLSA